MILRPDVGTVFVAIAGCFQHLVNAERVTEGGKDVKGGKDVNNRHPDLWVLPGPKDQAAKNQAHESDAVNGGQSGLTIAQPARGKKNA
jgi:hypothetical protein